jgi:D-alanine-D-alanine ligase
MKVAVVRNHNRDGVLTSFGRRAPEHYSEKTVRRVADALASGGHQVAVLEADITLPQTLARFLPPPGAFEAEEPPGMVYNLAYGIQGECRYTHLPAMLEMAGVPYTGAGPLGHTLSLDKAVTKTLISAQGVATPRWQLLHTPEDPLSGLRYPVVVKPVQESTSYGLHIADDADAARDAATKVIARYRQAALVEEYIEGREVCIGLIGNGSDLFCLPAVEIDFGERMSHLLTKSDKFAKAEQQAERICPAPLDDLLAARLASTAKAVFDACQCRDYARVDIRLDADERIWVLEINSMASLGPGGSFMAAAAVAGYDYAATVNLLLEVARRRYTAAAHEAAVVRDVAEALKQARALAREQAAAPPLAASLAAP